MKATTDRPKMTPEEAKRFTRTSINSYAQVVEQLGCECEPYQDVFTFNRWKAQGFYVRKGEKAKKLVTWVPVTPKDENEESYLVPRTLAVFCRHQVEANA